MSLIRYLLWFFIGWLLYRFIRQSIAASPGAGNAGNGSKTKPSRAIEKMVRCQVCELHVPQAEAIEDHGRYYCCEDHHHRDRQAP